MKRFRRAGWMLMAAVSAVFAYGGSAEAQYRVGDDGRALDANNRVGSGGFNAIPFGNRESLVPGARPQGAAAVTGNQIVTGNVTAGREFRGGVPYTDPRDFRGRVAGTNTDRFIAGSAGVPQPYQVPSAPLTVQVQPFYGQRLAAPPPPGFTERGFTGIYTPTPQPPQQPSEQYYRLGIPTENRLLTSSTLTLPGQIDAQTGLSTALTESGLLDERVLGTSGDLTRLSDVSSLRQENALSRLRLDPRQLQQMQSELLSPSLDSQDQGTDPTNQRPGGNLARPMVTPFDAPQDQNVSPEPLGANLAPQSLSGQIRADQSMGSRLMAPPSQQSMQYAELQRRLDRYYADRLQTDADRNREFQRQLRAREAAEKAVDPTRTTPGPKAPQPGPGTTPQPGPTEQAPTDQSRSGLLPDYAQIARQLTASTDTKDAAGQAAGVPGSAAKPEPLKVESLAAGVKAEGLAKLLNGAESLMKGGRYISALEQYQAAQLVAPNNAMIMLGQANAELGAGYYKRAEQHLRHALQADPVLTMAQFDLKNMLGQQRLEVLVKDLKEAARVQADDAGLVMLLAYVAYNTGNEEQAGIYLDLAEKRSGGKDTFPKLLKTHWSLPGSAPTTQPALNK